MHQACHLLVVMSLLAVGCAVSDSSPPEETTPGVESCPVTVPGNNPFAPASKAPDGPPAVYQAVWYGTPDLWTMVNPQGQVWSDLPGAADGSLVQKTFWWSDSFTLSEEPAPNIIVTAVSLDGSAPTVEAGGPGTNGSHPDIGNFMLVGLDIPQPGCWSITARYLGTALSYVVWAEG